jgi:hypothetical protein
MHQWDKLVCVYELNDKQASLIPVQVVLRITEKSITTTLHPEAQKSTGVSRYYLQPMQQRFWRNFTRNVQMLSIGMLSP